MNENQKLFGKFTGGIVIGTIYIQNTQKNKIIECKINPNSQFHVKLSAKILTEFGMNQFTLGLVQYLTTNDKGEIGISQKNQLVVGYQHIPEDLKIYLISTQDQHFRIPFNCIAISEDNENEVGLLTIETLGLNFSDFPKCYKMQNPQFYGDSGEQMKNKKLQQ